MFERVIIIGGGASIQEGVQKGLWDSLKDEVTVALNYAIRHFKDPTIVSFVDLSFYSMNVRELNTYPLLVTRQHRHIKEDNYVKLYASGNEYWGFNSLDKVQREYPDPTKPGTPNKIILTEEKGVYSMKLAGLFSLTYCMCLGFKEIYLLGFDFGETTDNNQKGKTHFYQNDFIHRGVGKKNVNGKERYNTLIYENSPEKYFDCYKPDLDKVKIYNVSPNSRINTFEKIGYDEFFQKLKANPVKINQTRARESIKKKLISGENLVIENLAGIKVEQNLVPTMQVVGETVIRETNASNKGIIIS